MLPQPQKYCGLISFSYIIFRVFFLLNFNWFCYTLVYSQYTLEENIYLSFHSLISFNVFLCLKTPQEIARYLCCLQRFITKEMIPRNGFALRKHNLNFDWYYYTVSEIFLLKYFTTGGVRKENVRFCGLFDFYQYIISHFFLVSAFSYFDIQYFHIWLLCDINTTTPAYYHIFWL